MSNIEQTAQGLIGIIKLGAFLRDRWREARTAHLASTKPRRNLRSYKRKKIPREAAFTLVLVQDERPLKAFKLV